MQVVADAWGALERGVCRSCFIAILLFVFAVPAFDNLVVPHLGSLARAAAMLVLLTSLYACRRGCRIRLDPGHWILLAFVLWAVVSVAWAQNTGAAVARAASYVQLWLIVVLIAQWVKEPERLVAMFIAFVAGCAALAGSVWWNFAQDLVWLDLIGDVAPLEHARGLATDYEVRYSGLRYNPNDLAYVLAVSLPIAAYLYVRGKPSTRFLVAGYMVAAVGVVALTGSRGGFIATAAGLGGMLFLYLRHAARRMQRLIAVAAVSVLAGVLAVSPTMERVSSMGEHGGSIHRRLVFAGAGLQAFLSAPLTGTGAGNFEHVTRPILTSRAPAIAALMDGGGGNLVAHNAIIEIAVENGVVGLLPFLAFVAYMVAKLLRVRNSFRGMLLVLGLQVSIILLLKSWQWYKVAWLLAAMAMIGTSITESPRARRNGAKAVSSGKVSSPSVVADLGQGCR